MFRPVFVTLLTILISLAAVFGQDVGNEKAAASGSTPTGAFSFGLVIDNSGSYRLLLEKVIHLAEDLIDQKTADDEAFLVTFVDTSKIRLKQEFTTVKEDLRDAAENMYIEGGATAIIDALKYSADCFEESSVHSEGNKRFMVLITDGDERSSAAKLEEVEKIVKERRIKIFAIGLAEQKVSLKLIEKIVKSTGGKLYLPRTREEIVATAKQLWADVRAN